MPQRSVKTIDLRVDNEFGVLTRITALVRREGFNIVSLAVNATGHPEISRLLLAVECIDTAFVKVMNRLKKLGCVREAVEVDESFDLSAELDCLFAGLKLTKEE